MIEQFIELVKSSTKWRGRFNRRQFVTVVIGINLISILIMAVASAVEPGGFIELLFVISLLAWIVVCAIIGVGADVRRFHDLDLSGWYVLLLLIPLISLLTFLYLVFKPGKEVGETRWG